jgi:hypothetical protein
MVRALDRKDAIAAKGGQDRLVVWIARDRERSLIVSDAAAGRIEKIPFQQVHRYNWKRPLRPDHDAAQNAHCRICDYVFDKPTVAT